MQDLEYLTNHENIKTVFLNEEEIEILIKIEDHTIEIEENEIIHLSMAPNDSEIQYYFNDEDSYIVIESYHQTLIPDRNITKIIHDGKKYILFISYIRFSENSPDKLATNLFYKLALFARETGFSQIALLAAGGGTYKNPNNEEWDADDYVGFKVWPKLGFDCELHGETKNKLKNEGKNNDYKYLSELLATEMEWWENDGGGCMMYFDLSHDSKSWEILDSYMNSYSKDLS